MKRVRSLAGIFRYYDIKAKNLIKIKSEEDKSIFFSIPQSNFSVLNGNVLGEDIPLKFKVSNWILKTYI